MFPKRDQARVESGPIQILRAWRGVQDLEGEEEEADVPPDILPHLAELLCRGQRLTFRKGTAAPANRRMSAVQVEAQRANEK